MSALEEKMRAATSQFEAAFDVRLGDATSTTPSGGRYREFLERCPVPKGEPMQPTKEDAVVHKFFARLEDYASKRGGVLHWREVPQCIRHSKPKTTHDVVMLYCRCHIGRA